MFKQPLFILLLLSLVLLLQACGASRSLKPLGEGGQQVDLSIGGPMVNQGGPIPVPYAVIGYGYGWTDKLNLHGTFHGTAAVFKTFGTELGVAYEILEEDAWIPEIMLDARGFIAADTEAAVFLPMITPVFSYRLGRWSPYVGMDHVFQFHDNDRVYLPQAIAPFGGLRSQWGSWQTGLEFKWLAANHDLSFNNVDHPKGLGNHGALAPYIFVSYEFGGEK